ncbi:hypothetical protein [Streptomyces sp. NPDC059957]|uniref:hypothetical protein n=1 Tax=unclassified Streptomyces TaxID=2593676 RepID=UPI003664E488
MQVVMVVKLVPSPEVEAALRDTLRVANDAANWLSLYAQCREGERDRSRMRLQTAAYQELKARGLSAQPALHVIRKVADAYKSRTANMKAGNYGRKDSERYRRIAHTPIRFRPTAAQAYDDRCLSWLNTKPEGFLGVDLGIANIATTSDAGEPFTGKELNKYRRRQVRIRAELQARGTKSAKRKLKQRSRREHRHATNTNHC